MQIPFLKKLLHTLLLSLVALSLLGQTGCKNGSTITPEEQAQFKNAPKEMPPEAVKYMQEHKAGPPANAKAPEAPKSIQ